MDALVKQFNSGKYTIDGYTFILREGTYPNNKSTFNRYYQYYADVDDVDVGLKYRYYGFPQDLTVYTEPIKGVQHLTSISMRNSRIKLSYWEVEEYFKSKKLKTTLHVALFKILRYKTKVGEISFFVNADGEIHSILLANPE